RCEALVGTQPRSHAPADPRENRWLAALEADQDEPRDHAVAQLIDEDLLLGRGDARQESRDVGADFGTGDEDCAYGHAGEPYAGGPQRAHESHAGALIISSR